MQSGRYLTANVYRGVWVSAPYPLDANEGADGDVVLELEIPDEAFVEHEWVEEGKPYREALIPAALLNEYLPSARCVPDEDASELRWGTEDRPRFVAVWDEGGRIVGFVENDPGS